jgi:hypothetical protein
MLPHPDRHLQFSGDGKGEEVFLRHILQEVCAYE